MPSSSSVPLCLSHYIAHQIQEFVAALPVKRQSEDSPLAICLLWRQWTFYHMGSWTPTHMAQDTSCRYSGNYRPGTAGVAALLGNNTFKNFFLIMFLFPTYKIKFFSFHCLLTDPESLSLALWLSTLHIAYKFPLHRETVCDIIENLYIASFCGSYGQLWRWQRRN